jgi:hypothetical protein
MEARSRQFGSGERRCDGSGFPTRDSQRSERVLVLLAIVPAGCRQEREIGLLGSEKGEEKRSRAEVTQLDLRLPSLRFHSNDQSCSRSGPARRPVRVGEA